MMRRGRRRVDDEQVRGPAGPEAEPERGEQSVSGIAEELRRLHGSIGNTAIGRLMRAQREAATEPVTAVPAEMQRRISAEAMGGQKLGNVASAMDVDAGVADSVRIHTGPAAEEMSSELGAHAFTQGRDVFIGAGRELMSPDGGETLAHELQHVAQGVTGPGTVQRQPVTSPSEVEEAPPSPQADGEQAAPSNEQEEIEMPPMFMSRQAQALQAMWDATVTVQLKAAVDALDKEPADAAEAATRLDQAQAFVATLAMSYRSQGKAQLDEDLVWLHTRLAACIRGLDALAGAPVSVETLQRDLNHTIPFVAKDLLGILSNAFKPFDNDYDRSEQPEPEEEAGPDKEGTEAKPPGPADPLDAMWEMAVIKPLESATEAINRDPPGLQDTLAVVQQVKSTVEGFTSTVATQGGNPERLSILLNELLAAERGLQANLGVPMDLGKLQEEVKGIAETSAPEVKAVLH